MTSPTMLAGPGALSDEERARDLRRMKAVALGFLVVAGIVYLVARRAEAQGAEAWVGYVRAAAEAGMVGGLADWFAVTALFRHPLGLKIPHTAIVPTKKDQLGRNLGDFVGQNFLSAQVIRTRVRSAQVTERVARWLAQPRNAERTAGELAVAARGVLTVLDDAAVQEVIEETVLRRIAAMPAGPPLGRLLDEVVAEGSHRGLVDLLADNVHGWVLASHDTITDVVLRQAPSWSPRLVDELVAEKVYSEVLRFTAEVHQDPEHRVRKALDDYLIRLAHDLRHDPDTMARADSAKDALLAHPDVHRALGDLWATIRRLVLVAVDDPHSELRRRTALGLASLGTRLIEDENLRGRVDGWVEQGLVHVVTTYRDELTTTITETVERWDAQEASRRIELAVGRDLQFIRLNGTIVGALAGLVIHAVGQLVS